APATGSLKSTRKNGAGSRLSSAMCSIWLDPGTTRMLTDLLYRLRAMFRRDRLDMELEDELRCHLDRETEKYLHAGVPEEEAKRRARLALGGIQQVIEECRDSRGVF